MADQRSPVRTVVAVSLAVIACCALVSTIKVLTGAPPRVLDSDAVARSAIHVAAASVSNPPKIDDVSCPASIVVEVGREFECEINRRPGQAGPEKVKLRIDDEQGKLSEASSI